MSVPLPPPEEVELVDGPDELLVPVAADVEVDVDAAVEVALVVPPEQVQAPKPVPLWLQVCAPVWLLGQAHDTDKPGMHAIAPPEPDEALPVDVVADMLDVEPDEEDVAEELAVPPVPAIEELVLADDVLMAEDVDIPPLPPEAEWPPVEASDAVEDVTPVEAAPPPPVFPLDAALTQEIPSMAAHAADTTMRCGMSPSLGLVNCVLIKRPDKEVPLIQPKCQFPRKEKTPDSQLRTGGRSVGRRPKPHVPRIRLGGQVRGQG